MQSSQGTALHNSSPGWSLRGFRAFGFFGRLFAGGQHLAAQHAHAPDWLRLATLGSPAGDARR